MARTISSLGTPLSMSTVRGKAKHTDREGATGNRSNHRNNERNNAPTYQNLLRYQRLNTTDANNWRKTKKHKHEQLHDTHVELRDNNATDIDDNIMAIEEQAERAVYNRWHVPRIGNMPSTRPEGVFRLMGAQLNSISSTECRDKKVAEIERIINTWEIQGGCFQEVGINWSAIGHKRNMTS